MATVVKYQQKVRSSSTTRFSLYSSLLGRREVVRTAFKAMPALVNDEQKARSSSTTRFSEYSSLGQEAGSAEST